MAVLAAGRDPQAVDDLHQLQDMLGAKGLHVRRGDLKFANLRWMSEWFACSVCSMRDCGLLAAGGAEHLTCDCCFSLGGQDPGEGRDVEVASHNARHASWEGWIDHGLAGTDLQRYQRVGPLGHQRLCLAVTSSQNPTASWM